MGSAQNDTFCELGLAVQRANAVVVAKEKELATLAQRAAEVKTELATAENKYQAARQQLLANANDLSECVE